MFPYSGMVKRLLTFALSAGFFIWLPNAFADGNGILSLDAPSHIRQTQNDDNALLTLRVDNIQVRAEWRVDNAANAFDVADGVLRLTATETSGLGTQVVTIYVEDKFDLLNDSYANLTASAVITVEFKSGEFGLLDAPLLMAVAGEAGILHTFSATGGSGNTYTLVAGDERYFSVNATSGVLSLQASVQAGVYTLTVEVADDNSGTVVALATVEVSAALMLADAPLLSVALGAAVSLHKFIASGGIGRKTYTLAAGDESYFSVNADSGVLFLRTTAKEGVHTLTVQAIDEGDRKVNALATVRVSAALTLAEVPSFTVIANVGMNLHTLVANGGIGVKTYTLLDGDGGEYFSVDATSGVLSLSVNTPAGEYMLIVQAKDEHANTVQAVATVEVSAALSLADAPRLGGAQGTMVSLHTFAAKGGIGARTYTLLAGDDKNYFSLDAESGVLSLLTVAPLGTYTLSVQVRDDRGNTADALATVGVDLLFLADAPQLYAIVGREVSLHTFDAKGVDGTLSYTITEGDVNNYFNLDTDHGVLSVGVDAPIGIYTLLVSVSDARSSADATAIVEVRASLSLVAMPPLTVIVGRVAHTLTASGGIGTHTYAILSGDEDGGFALGAASGVLSLRADAALGRHTLTLQVADERANTVQAVATVEVSAALALSDAPPFTVVASVAMSLYTFIASGGIGIPTYAIVSGNEKGHFDLGAASGVLSLAADAEPDTYVLRIQATDARDNTDEAVATVEVSAVLSLADAPRLTAVAGEAMSLHAFSAKGGIGTKTYTLKPGDDVGHFGLDKNSGVLSLQVSAQAGVYTLTVQVADADDGSGPVGAVATVEVSAALMLADAPLLSVVLGAAVSLHMFTASGGIGRKTYTLAAGDKGYFSVNAGSGVLSLLATVQAGVHMVTVQAIDEGDRKVNAVATVRVSAALMLADAPPFTVIASAAMSLHTFIASGGIGTPTYTILASNEKEGFTLNAASGVLSLQTDAAVGSHTLTVQVMDARDNTVQAVATVEVSAALVLAAAPSFTVIASVGMSLHMFIASGGIGTPTYTILAGNEGRDFTLNATSGVLSLSVNAEVGSHTLTVQVLDAHDNTAQVVVMVGVSAALALADAPPFTVIISAALSLHTFIASGGIGTPTYTILAGNEKGGFTLNAASGVLSLQADAEPDTYVLMIQAMDGRDNTAETVATVGVSAVLILADAPRLGGSQGTPISLYMFAAQGGIGARTYTLLTDDVEDYFSLGAESGVLSLLAAAPVATYTLSVQVKDDRGNVADALATVGVDLLFLSDALLYAIVGREVSLHTFDPMGVEGALTYTITAGNNDGYFNLDADHGVLSVGANAPIGIYTLSVLVKDGRSEAEALAVVEVRASLSLVTVPLLTVVVDKVAHTLAASGGIGKPTYAIVSGDEDGGFAVDAASGVLSLRADAALGRHTLTLQVADARKNTVQAVATVEVSAALVLSDAPPFTVIASVAVSLHRFIASGGIGVPTYTIVSGNEKGHFDLGAASGVLSLAADAEPDTYVLRIQATDARGNTDEALATVGVSAVLSLSDAPRLTAVAGEVMSLHTFSAKGGIGNNTYTLVGGDDADYFDLDKNSGVLSLQASAQEGVYTLTVQVADADGDSGPVGAVATVEVSAALMLADAPLLSVALGAAVSLHTFTASGGIGIKTYTLAAGDKGYFSVNANSGVLSLLATAQEGVHMITVQAIDEGGRKVEALATVRVLAALMLADAPPFTVIASMAMSLHTFIASGGIGVKTYTLSAGNDGEYFSVDAASGVLSLSINAPVKDYMLTVQVMDEHGNTDQAMATVEVSAALSLAEVSPLTIIVGDVAHALVASGGIGVKTYTITGGDEKGYFALDVISGILSLSADAPVKVYTLTVRATDERNNIAELVAMVEAAAMLALADAPSFTVIASAAMDLHTFIASGGIGVKTYTLLADDDGEYFSVDAASGVLSLSVNAPVKEYMLTVQVMDERGNTAQAVAMVRVSAVLSLAGSPLLEVIAGDALNLHTFVAGGGIGSRTYTLLAGDEYFSVGAGSGVLSLSAGAGVGRHTLTVQVMDERDNTAQAVATVGVSAVLALAAPPLTVIASAVMSLHTFIASGGIGSRTYTLLAGDEGYFSVGADSGVLSVNAEVGRHTLTVQVMDARDNTAQAVVMVEVSTALVLAEAPPFTVIISAALSLHTFIASGGIGTPTYAVVSGNEAGHFTLNATSGVLSLQADAEPATYVLRIQAMDAHHNTAEVLATVGVSAVLSLADAPRLGGAQGIAVSLHTFVAQGGIGSRTYTLLAGDAKGYFSLDAESGVLSLLTVAPVATYTLSVQVKDERGNVADALATVGVVPLFLSDVPPLFAVVGREVSLHTFVAKGVVGTLSYTIAEGNVNSYFNLDADYGVLSVEADVPIGIYTLLVSVSDARSSAKALAVVEVRASLSLVAVPPLTVIVGKVAHTLAASGGIGTPTYAILAGNTGGHFALDAASGVLSLQADTALGRHTLTLQVADARTNTVQAVVTVGVSAVLSLAEVSLLEGIAGDALSLHTFAADGGIGSRTYILLAGDDGYFSVGAGSGVLSLSANAEVGRHTLTVQVMDERGNTDQAVVTVGVSAVLALAKAPLLEAIAGDVLSLHTFVAGGGIGSRTYTLLAGDDGYFSVGAGSGVLSLSVAAAVGRHTLTVQVMDGRDNTAQAVATVGVSAALVLAEAPSFTVIASAAMSLHTFVASGGIGIKTYTLVAGDDGEYFAVDAASGVLALSVNAPVKEYMLTVQVMDERGNTAQAVATVGVSAVLSLAEVPLLEAIVGDALSLHTFVADGGIGSRTYTLLAGNDGYFSVGAESGVLSLSVAAAVGRHTLTVQVMDERGNTAQAVAMVGVSAVLVLAAPPFTVIASAAMSLHTFIASGGIGLRTYTLLASDDDGYFSVDAASGVFSLSVNTPAKDYRLTVQVMDERGSTVQAVATVGVSAALVLAEAPPFTVIATVAMSLHTFIASGGIGVKTYTLAAGDDGEYFSVDATSGVFSLSVNAPAKDYRLTVQVMDEHGNIVHVVATVGVSAVLSLTDAPLLWGTKGEAESLYTFEAIGGLGAKTYTVVAGAEYFSVGATSGVLSVDASVTVGIYTLSVQVADADGNVAPALATVNVVFLLLRDVMLYAIVGREVSLHTFEADGGGGEKLYVIVGGNVPQYFTIDATIGVLSARGNAPVGVYTLSMVATDTVGNRSEALAVVAVEASLFLADEPSLGALTGITMSVHTFAASGGIGAKTYTLAAAEGQEYFALDAASGVLSVVNAPLGVYTLSVTVSDSRGNQAQARGTVEVVEVLSLADVSLAALARLSVTVSLTTFTPGDGYGAKRYEMVVDESGYFAIDVDSGKLSLPSNSAMRAGAYVLSVEVSDSLVPPQRATAAVMVRIAKNGIFVLGGNESQSATNDLQNDVWSSMDGESWREDTSNAGWTARENHRVVAYRGRMYLMGGWEPGSRNDVWSSLDGKNWSLVTGSADWPARGLHQALVHNGRMYVLGGGQDGAQPRNDVWSSLDGVTWREDKANNSAGWTARQSHQAVSHNGRLYVLGGNDGSGYKNDVWSSADGVNWRFEGNAEWTGRWLYKAVSHNGRLYILGGNDGGRRNDVWSSLDGRSWVEEQANNNAFWTKRGRHHALSRDGLLYVLGGNDNGLRKDVWSSSDGKNWTEETAVAGWEAREYHQAVVFPSPLILWGAGETITLTLQVSAAEVYTVTAQYGVGTYTYSSTPKNIGFNIDRNGVLSADDNIQAGAYVITVQVEDEEGSLAQTRIEIEVLPVVPDAPALFAIVGKAENLHTFVARDQARTYTYTMVSGNGEGYFTLGAASGLLSVSGAATVGLYTLSVEISNSENYRATARATVEVRRLLSLAEALSLTATVGQGGFHTFAAQDGIGPYTYTLLSGNDLGYFVLDESSGSLSLKAEAEARLYTLTVQVSDSRGSQAQAPAVVRGLVSLSWLGLPPLTAIARLSVELTLHTAVLYGAVGTITYAIAAGNVMGYFAFDADSGVLSLPVNGMRLTGDYTLSLAVSDSAVPPHQATAAVMVRLVKNGIFVLGGNDGRTSYKNDVWWSADGEAWKRETANAGWSERHAHQVVVYQGRLYVLGGYDYDDNIKNDVWSSADGRMWTEETANVGWSRRYAHQAVSFNGRLYVLGGRLKLGTANDVWSWAEGEESWSLVTAAAWPARQGHQAVVHNGRLYVLGGWDSDETYYHDVWSSADGANWSFEGNAEWPARWRHEAVSHQGRLYKLGGRFSLVETNDVWSSLAGKSWQPETADGNNFWSKRGRFGAVSRDGLLYVLGGNGSHGNQKNDVWSSADGRSWTKVTDAAWSAREVRAVVFPSPIILSGTSEKINLILGVSAAEVYTVTAQYGLGAYTYSLTPENIGFNIDSNGVLSTDDSIQAGAYVIAVQVRDEEGSLAQTMIEIEALPVVPDAPSLFAIVGKAENLHTFVARDQAGTYTYTIVSGNGEEYFTVGVASGLLSVNSEAVVGLYTLSVEISDSENYRATARATVEVRSLLSLAEALSLTATVGQGLHTFAAQDGIGPYTYTLLSGNDMGYFVLGESSGKLLLKTEADAGLYTLTVQVSDSRGSQAQALAVVRALVFLSWSGLPPLPAIARLSVEVTLHTAVVHGAVGTVTYALAADNDTGYFAFDADSGVLSLPVNGARLAGDYTLLLAMSDGAVPPHQATAAVVVRLVKNAIFVMGGNATGLKNDVWWSGDGKAWRSEAQAGWLGRIDFQAVAYQGRLYVLGGRTLQPYSDHNDVWSADGVTWREDKADNNAGWPARREHQAVVHNDRMYVLGGEADGARGNDVWSSADGETWSLVTGSADWPARKRHQSVAHNGRMYVLGGSANGIANDVWSSADGSSWRFEGNADWGAREYHQAVSHQGRLYILGGQNSDNEFNDVWSSLDGKSWRQELADGNNFWLKRHEFKAVSRDGLLYVLGGARGRDHILFLENDVWSSADGRSWTKVGDADWSARFGHQAVVFPPNLALSGTSETITLALQGKSEIYPFSARYGFGQYTYSLSPKVPGFSIDESSGVLLLAGGNAAVGGHTLTVQVEDEEDSRAQTEVKIEVVSIAALELADTPSFVVVAGAAMSLHTFIASGGLGDKTYTLVAGEEAGIFMLGAESGVLSVVMNAPAGVYTLSVQVSDRIGNTVQVGGTVEVVVPLSLLQVPPLTAWVRLSEAVTLHMLVASGGSGAKRYAIIAGNAAGYFAVGESSGVLSLLTTAWEGVYTLSVEVSESSSLSLKATAVATVEISRQIFVLGGNDGSDRLNDVWFSADGKNWGRETAHANWTMRSSHQALSHNGQLYVLGGNDGTNHLSDVWFSADGANWSREPDDAGWTGREGHQALSHNGRLYVLGGSAGGSSRLSDVWSSADGKNWVPITTNAKWTGRFGHQALSHNGRIYVLGGLGMGGLNFFNDVWSSADGANWEEETAHANWTMRYRHQALSHNGRLYVLGGRDNEFRNKNDVWSSADGASWTLETNGAGWSKRNGHQALSHNGRIYVLGGDDEGSEELNDVWSSADGASWTREPNDANWSGRLYHQAVIFPPPLELLGVGDRLIITAGTAGDVHTFTAQYGRGNYSYSLTPIVSGFAVNAGGVLSADNVSIGSYTLTVWVKDEKNSQAQTAVKVDVALSIAALSLADAPLADVMLYAIVGREVSLHTFETDGGSEAAKTYTIVAGNEDDYFTLDANRGVLSVQGNAPVGIYTLSVAVDGEGRLSGGRAGGGGGGSLLVLGGYAFIGGIHRDDNEFAYFRRQWRYWGKDLYFGGG